MSANNACLLAKAKVTSQSHPQKVSGHILRVPSSSFHRHDLNQAIATPTTPPKASCTTVAPGSKDSPASKDPGTGLLFRATCGITDETVDQCPYLCSQAGGGAFKECFDVDLSGLEPTGQFPPIECTHCLPPCKAGKRFKRK